MTKEKAYLPWEVQTAFIGGCWENVWAVDEAPEYFATKASALYEARAFLDDQLDAGMDGGDCPDCLRITNRFTGQNFNLLELLEAEDESIEVPQLCFI